MHETTPSGTIVEFLLGNQAQIALVIEEQPGKLRLYTSRGRETKLAASRVLPWTGPRHEGDLSRAEMDRIIARHDETRGSLAAALSTKEIWELAQGEVTQARARFFAELIYENPDPDQEAAAGRALLEDKSRFKFQPPDFTVLPPETVQARERELAELRLREKIAATGQAFFRELWNDGDPDETASRLLDAETAEHLKNLLLDRIAESDDRKAEALWREMAKPLPDHPCLALVLARRWGVVDPHHNHLYDRAGYLPGDEWAREYDEEIGRQAEASRTIRFPEEPGRFVSIDSETTRDIDDALAVARTPEGFDVRVALACPAADWDFDSPLGRAVLSRATSIYLPEGDSHMLPEALSTDAFSLLAGEPRKSLVLHFSLDDRGDVQNLEIRPARVAVAENMSYASAEEALSAQEDEFWSAAGELAGLLRDRRLNRGAVVIERPDPDIRLEPDGDDVRVQLGLKEEHPRAQLLVSELMILANEGAATWAGERGVTLLHRTQDITIAPESRGVWRDPEDIYRVVKVFGPTLLEPQPRPHRALGLAAYAPVTSPLRRYPDLVNEAQILAWLDHGSPRWSRDDLESMLPHLSSRLEAAGQVQRFRPRYWKLLYFLQNRKERTWTGIAVDDGGGLITLALPEAQIFVRAPRNMLAEKIYPGQRFELTFGRIDPLTNEIRVSKAMEIEDARDDQVRS